MARNPTKAASAIERLKTQHPDLSISFVKCEMTSLASVQSAAREFIAAGHGRLDVLVCNAGTMCVEPEVTEDGYQIEWQTNHLAHALLIKLLIPTLRETAAKPDGDARIINLSSQGYQSAPGGIEFATLNTKQEKLGNWLVPGHRWSRYGQSKLANMLYADALAREFPDIMAVSVHPGYIFTDLFNGVPFLTKLPVYLISRGQTLDVNEGAHAQLWAATVAREKLVSGTYYEPVGLAPKRTTKPSNDPKLAGELWDWTQTALKEFSL